MDLLTEIRNKKESWASYKRNTEKQVYFSELERLTLFYGDMKLEGKQLSVEEVSTMLRGEILPNASIDDHMKILRFDEMLKKIHDLLEMHYSLDLKLAKEFYTFITNSRPDYRTDNFMIARYAYKPIVPTEIDEQMELLFNSFTETDNEVRDAMEIHNRIMEIYPFPNGNESVARMCAYYILLGKGYPLFAPGFSTGEYRNYIQEYLKSGRSENFYNAILRSIYNRLDYLLGMSDGE